MSNSECFGIIDKSINKFNADKHFEVLKDSQSDLSTHDWRKIVWEKNEVDYLIEIFPDFDNDLIPSWTLHTVAFYDDKNEDSYYLKKEMVAQTDLAFIANNIDDLLHDAYSYISSVEKDDILKVVYNFD